MFFSLQPTFVQSIGLDFEFFSFNDVLNRHPLKSGKEMTTLICTLLTTSLPKQENTPIMFNYDYSGYEIIAGQTMELRV